MDRNQGAGIVWSAAGIIYVIVIFLADFDTKVVVVGALLLGLLAVTSPWWRPMIGSNGPGSGN